MGNYSKDWALEQKVFSCTRQEGVITTASKEDVQDVLKELWVAYCDMEEQLLKMLHTTPPEFCPCESESPEPCPACGATIDGKDPVRGICQATRGKKPDTSHLPRFIVIEKNPGIKVRSVDGD